jgi:capsular polysaccharide transport system permease protein
MSNAPTDSRPATPALRAVETGPAAAAAPKLVASSAQPAAASPAPKPAAPAQPAAKPAPAPAKPVAAAVPAAKPAPAAVPAKPAVAKPAPAPAKPAAPRPIPVRPGAMPARARFRHYVALTSFLLAVLLPLAASVWYLFARAEDQYTSTTAFSVRSEEMAGGAASLLGVLTQVGGGSASDTDILFDFIRSQEIVQAIDARLDLRAIYNRAGPGDVWFRLGDDPSIEALVDQWHRMVQVDLESHAGILNVQVKAFTPADATAIAGAILEESTALVNRLSEQAREDAVRFARQELAEAEANLRSLRGQLAAYRRDNRIVDPSADVAGQMGLLSALQGELAKAMVERDQLLSFVGETDQRVIQAERRINAIDQRIEAERAALGASDSQVPLADVVGRFEELKVDLEFANAAYTQAMAAVTAARAEARRQSRYLAPHVLPTSAEQALYPRRLLLSGLILLFLTLGWGILMLIYYNVRDTR